MKKRWPIILAFLIVIVAAGAVIAVTRRPAAFEIVLDSTPGGATVFGPENRVAATPARFVLAQGEQVTVSMVKMGCQDEQVVLSAPRRAGLVHRLKHGAGR